MLWLAEPLVLPVPPGYLVDELSCTGLIWNRYDRLEVEPSVPPGIVIRGEVPPDAQLRSRYLFTWLVSVPDRPAGVPLLLTAWPPGRSFMESVNDAMDDARAEGLARSLVPVVDPAMRNLAGLMSMLEAGTLRCHTRELRGHALARLAEEVLELVLRQY